MFDKDKILLLLDDKGWSKYKLAKKAGIPQSSLHDILSGKIKNPTAERLKAVADALGVSVDDFFDDEVQIENKKTDKSIEENLPVIPKKFTNPNEARVYVYKHQIFGANGFNSDKLSDDEILEFANELLKQMELISFKFKK